VHAIMSHLGCGAVCIPNELLPSFAALASSSLPAGATLSFPAGAALSMAVLFKRSASADLLPLVGALLGRSIFLDVSTIDGTAGGRADSVTR